MCARFGPPAYGRDPHLLRTRIDRWQGFAPQHSLQPREVSAIIHRPPEPPVRPEHATPGRTAQRNGYRQR